MQPKKEPLRVSFRDIGRKWSEDKRTELAIEEVQVDGKFPANPYSAHTGIYIGIDIAQENFSNSQKFYNIHTYTQ